MARGALKGLKRNRPTPGEKVVIKGQSTQGTGGRSLVPSASGTTAHGGVLNANGTSDLDGGDLVSWLNCECVFSLIFVGLLAALPFNLHTQELMQTPETYVARAIELSGERAYDKAAALYERAVNTEETPERHVLLAEALVQAERRHEALSHYERAANLYEDRHNKTNGTEELLHFVPQNTRLRWWLSSTEVLALLNLGQVQTDEGLSHDAVETYLKVLSLQKKEDSVDADEVAEAHYQVATSLLDDYRHAEALEQLRLAAALAPEPSQAQILLAHTLRDMGLVEDAIRRYNMITSQWSTDVGTLVQLGFAYHELCDFSQALAVYKKARSSPTKAAEMDYLTAALHSKSFRPPRAPAAYVSNVFDLEARKSAFLHSDPQKTPQDHVGGIDKTSGASMEGMKSNPDRGMFYDVHGLIFDRVAPNMRLMIESALGLSDMVDTGWSHVGGRNLDASSLRWLDVLDLGCGRGRMGVQLRSLANYMTGVDLSEEALKHASRTRTYDSIRHGDALTVSKGMLPNSVDLVVAADLVPYFGDLAELLRAVAALTRPGGLVAFNADLIDEHEGSSGGNGRAYELRFTGRWSHRRKYVTQSVTAAGLSVLGVRVVKGHTRLISPGAGEIVLEAAPQERQSTIFLCGKGTAQSTIQ